MSLSVFEEKAFMPDDAMLTEVLKDGLAHWNQIKEHIAMACDDVSEQWKYYSKKAGWTLVIKSGGRTVTYLIPLQGYFKMNFVFGEKAATAAQSAELPNSVIALIAAAKPYVEGRSFMIDIRSAQEIEIAKKLIALKC